METEREGRGKGARNGGWEVKRAVGKGGGKVADRGAAEDWREADGAGQGGQCMMEEGRGKGGARPGRGGIRKGKQYPYGL